MKEKSVYLAAEIQYASRFNLIKRHPYGAAFMKEVHGRFLYRFTIIPDFKDYNFSTN